MNKHLGYIKKGFLSALLTLLLGLVGAVVVMTVMYFVVKSPRVGVPLLALVYVLFFAWCNGRMAS